MVWRGRATHRLIHYFRDFPPRQGLSIRFDWQELLLCQDCLFTLWAEVSGVLFFRQRFLLKGEDPPARLVALEAFSFAPVAQQKRLRFQKESQLLDPVGLLHDQGYSRSLMGKRPRRTGDGNRIGARLGALLGLASATTAGAPTACVRGTAGPRASGAGSQHQRQHQQYDER